jgi:hypothetical protein
VQVKRAADAARATGKPAAKVGARLADEDDDSDTDEGDVQTRVDELATSAAPRVGAKPASSRPGAAKRAPAGRTTGRSAGSKRRH